jgi:hypothetical protein
MMGEARGVELSERLRRTSDDFLARLDELEELETEKRKLEPGSPAFQALAERVREMSADLYQASQVQRAIGDEAADLKATGHGEAPVLPIDALPTRDIAVILAEWRDRERQLAQFGPDSPDAERVRADTERLRAEYRAAFEWRQKGDRRR